MLALLRKLRRRVAPGSSWDWKIAGLASRIDRWADRRRRARG
jgi:hypothetical protein